MRKTFKRTRIKATLLAAAIATLPLAASAAGLGKITVLSALGQPLRAELEVTATRDETPSLVAKVAPADAFRQAGIDYAPALATLRFSRDIKERNGRRYIELTTDRPLNEPFIDMLVELSWASGRLVREYTFLLDPPEVAPKAAAVAAPEVKIETPRPVDSPAEKPVDRSLEKAAEKSASPAVETRPAGDLRPAAKPSARPVPVAPKPAARPAAAESAVAASRKVESGDTLGKIAAESKPEGVNLDQMLVALFRSNKEAFDGENMNRLKAGKILAIPDADAVAKIGADDARREVVAQASDFNAYRKKLAAAASAEPAREQGAKQAASGKIAPRVEDKVPPPAAGKDKLEVSRTEAAKDAKSKQLQGRVATLEEDLVARDKALKEANSRVSELEKNLKELKKLAELKSQAGADLQKQAQAAKAPEAKASDSKPAAPVAAAAKPGEAAKAETPKAETPKAEPPKVEASKPEAAKPEAVKPEAVKPDAVKPDAAKTEAPVAAESAKPATEAEKPVEAPKPPPPKKKPLPPPPPEPEPDFIEENAPLVFGGGGIVALLLGWLGLSAYRRKRQAADAPPVIAASDLASHSVFGGTTVAPPPSEQEPSQFSDTAINIASTPQEMVDPVVEADTFLAFGRDAQAEDILLEALQTDPQRTAVHMKLLDIYAARKSAGQFESVARALHAQTGGSGPDWERAATMGAALDPANALYGGEAAAAEVTETPAAPLDMDATLVLDASPLAEQAPASPLSAEEPEPSAVDTSVLDFDLDLGDAAEPVAEAASAPAEQAHDANEVAALDFDLDLGTAEPVAPVADAAPASTEMPALDIDFDMPAPTADDTPALDLALSPEIDAAVAAIEPLSEPLSEPLAEPIVESTAEPATESNVIDFEFDLETPAAQAEAPALPEEAAPIAEAPPLAPPPIDLGAISLDLDVPLDLPAEEAAPALDLPVDEVVPDNPEVATKLELAMAYEEMGDRDGARELYLEALAEGSPTQQELARTKLAAFG